MSISSHETLAKHFSLLPDADERLRSLIQLGRSLPPLDESERIEENLVRGCVSSVWLVCDREARSGTLRFGVAAMLSMLRSSLGKDIACQEDSHEWHGNKADRRSLPDERKISSFRYNPLA